MNMKANFSQCTFNLLLFMLYFLFNILQCILQFLMHLDFLNEACLFAVKYCVSTFSCVTATQQAQREVHIKRGLWSINQQ